MRSFCEVKRSKNLGEHLAVAKREPHTLCYRMYSKTFCEGTKQNMHNFIFGFNAHCFLTKKQLSPLDFPYTHLLTFYTAYSH